MCGRFTHLFKWKQLQRLMVLTSPPWEFPRRYNVAPTQNAPVVRAGASGEGASGVASGGQSGGRVDMLRWGLIPSWADDPSIGGRLINARAETVHEKPAFRSAFESGRPHPHGVDMSTAGSKLASGLWLRSAKRHGQVVPQCAITAATSPRPIAPLLSRSAAAGAGGIV